MSSQHTPRPSLTSQNSSLDERQTAGESEEKPLPEYKQKIFSILPILVLISHGHSPPLNPQPHLAFDLRSLSNPPKHIRDLHNGTSKRLQEWMSRDPVFVARRRAIQTDIENAMRAALKGSQTDKLTTTLADMEDSGGLGGKCGKYFQDGVEEETIERHDDEISSSGSISSEELSEASGPSSVFELRVGINCQMGRHRSVAMVEDLAKLDWPGWQVKVEHRDMLKKRGNRHEKGGRQGKDSRKREGIRRFMEET